MANLTQNVQEARVGHIAQSVDDQTDDEPPTMAPICKLLSGVHEATHSICLHLSLMFRVTEIGIRPPAEGFTHSNRFEAEGTPRSYKEKRAEFVSFVAAQIAENKLLNQTEVGSADDLQQAAELLKEIVEVDGTFAEELGYAGIETNNLDDERRKKVNDVKDRIRNDCQLEAETLIEQNKALIFALADKLIRAERMTIGQEEFAEFMASANLIGPPQNPPEIDYPKSPEQLQLFYAISQPAPTDVTPPIEVTPPTEVTAAQDNDTEQQNAAPIDVIQLNAEDNAMDEPDPVNAEDNAMDEDYVRGQ